MENEENVPETASSPEETDIEKLKTALEEAQAKLEEAQKEAEETKRKWYRVSAEYENYRKRTSAQSAARYLEGRCDVVGKLFPIADNLERALAGCGDEGTRKGLEMVLASFKKLLSEEKITEIDPRGEPFDAEKHEAIAAVEGGEGEESGTVKETYLKGYEREGKVLRFAQVVVVK